MLQAGFAQCDITPPLGLPLGGYGARLTPADGVLDALLCRAAVFDDGIAPVAIVVLDLVHVLGSWVARVRARAAAEAGVGPDRLLIAATHTHAGPGVFRSAAQSDARVTEYEDALIAKIAGCVAAARHAGGPALLSFGGAQVCGVAANRRDPSLPIDDAVRVLCARTPSGALRGVLANFACHSTVLSAANCSYSGDLFGAAAAAAARRFGVPVLLANGAGGDVSTRFTRRDQTPAEVQRLGHILAEALGAAVQQATAVDNGPVLGAARHAVDVRWRALPSPQDAGAELRAAHAALEVLQTRGADAATLRLAQSRIEGAQAELWISSQGGWQALFGPHAAVAEVQALRCGEVTIVSAPGELFSSASQWLRSQLGERTLLVGYANDYLGYFIPEADARDGGYESLIAMIDPGCEAAIRSGLVAAARRASH